MNEQLEALQKAALAEISAAPSLAELDETRVRYLGRKGQITEILRGLAAMAPEERAATGQAANAVKQVLGQAVESRKASLEAEAEAQAAASEAIDLSLPGRQPRRGHAHVIEQTMQEMLGIFNELGFEVATGPDIETEYYNFESLNIPADHPARDSHDTFFVKPGTVLRTHTSPVQMRVMEKTQPPVAVVAPGRVYRVDYDATHSPMFFQLEGLLVDERVTFADLKGTLMRFVQRMFGEDTAVRFRPHYFPFTEPSAEVDILWTARNRHTGETESRWLEILGCGMVNPKVFEYAGYDTAKYTGYAFGMGVDRIAMVRHAINNIHLLYQNDLRFLEQF